MENEWKCKQCTKTFTEKRNLTRHINDVHEKQKIHECGICQKQFTRKRNKELHLKHCSGKRNHQGTIQDRTYKPANDLTFNVTLRQSAFGGCFSDWMIGYPQDYYFIEPIVLLKASVKTMKSTLINHLREHNQFKFRMVIHVNFIKATDPDIQTIPPVVLTTTPHTVWPVTDIDEELDAVPNELMLNIEEYEACGSGWIIDHLVRFDTIITSFSCLGQN